jgi:hypothetical protein
MQPQPRSLDAIISELNSTYDPQINSIRARQAELPGQVQAEEQGLDAKKNSAYEDILNGARRRGTGVAFGGVPLGEQAKYAATEYMPALAKLRQSARENQLSLEDAIHSIYEKRNTFANQIKQNEDQLFESRRQFDTTLAFQKEQEANRLREAARAAASSGGGMPSFGGGMTMGGAKLPAGKAASPVAPELQGLFNQMFMQGNGQKWDDKALKNDYAATLRSANYGNPRDKQKIMLYHSVRPDLFGSSVSASALGNGGQLRF